MVECSRPAAAFESWTVARPALSPSWPHAAARGAGHPGDIGLAAACWAAGHLHDAVLAAACWAG